MPKNLSDFWREDKTDDRVLELASVLQGSDSLIGVMGSGVRATWSTNGESATWWVQQKNGKPVQSRVFLDYSPLASLKPPFAGRAVDEVIGYAAHEGGHCLWSSATAGQELETSIARKRQGKRGRPTGIRPTAPELEEALRVANILEDAYIDFHASETWPVLGEYIRWSRECIATRNPIDHAEIARQAKPPRNHILNLWIACSLYDQDLPAHMAKRVREAMTFLMDATVKAVKEADSGKRLELAAECWLYLVGKFPDQPIPLPRMVVVQAKGGGGGGQGQASGAAGKEKGAEPQGGGGGGGGKAEADKGEGVGGGGDHQEEGAEAEGAKAEAEAEEGPEEGQKLGHFGGEAEAEADTEDEGDNKGQDATSEQGGDGAGAPENLDSFDVRDIGEMPKALQEEVMEAVAHELEDLSRSVAEALGPTRQEVQAQTKRADYDGPAAERVKSQVEREIRELQRLFDRQAQVQSRHIHGLLNGKLDNRRLARVGTGNLHAFKRREVLDRPDLAVGLLLDVSGSMSSYMPIVWATGAVFGEALVRKPGVDYLCLTYTGGFFQVQTTRICDRQMGRLHLGNVDQGGGTPSGPAIASMRVLMDRMKGKEKLIIHFTDGQPDDSSSVVAVVNGARKAGYRVWAISLHSYKGMLAAQYGEGNYRTIGSVGELPRAVAELLKEVVR